MAQEFTIKSSAIEDKINQLLPSQGGFEPGVDFSASTMVIPVVDLTETAEGSNVRQDLQTALSFTTATTYFFNNSFGTIVNTPGYWRIVGTASCFAGGTVTGVDIRISDGITAKAVFSFDTPAVATSTPFGSQSFDLIVFLRAGDDLQAVSDVDTVVKGSVRQIADINGNLINP